MPTGTTSSGNVIVKKDVGINPEGRDIIIIEDICDTGNTFKSGRAQNRRTLACTRRSGRTDAAISCRHCIRAEERVLTETSVLTGT